MNLLWDYIKEYKIIYLRIIPSWFIVGWTFSPGLYVLVPVCALYLAVARKHIALLLLFCNLMILADHDGLLLTPLMQLRLSAIVTMTIFIFYHMRLGYYKFNTHFLHILPLLVVILLSMNMSNSMGTAFSKGLSFVLLYFVGVHMVRFIVHEFGPELMRAIALNATILLLVSVTLIFLRPDLVYYGAGYGAVRFNGMFRNPNGLGLYIAMMLPFIHQYFIHFDPPKNFRRIIIGLVIICLVLCSSRNALLASTFYLLLTKGLLSTPFGKVLLFGGIMPMVIVIIQTITIEKLVMAVGLDKYLRLKELDTGSGRTHAWAFAISQIPESPLIGMGFGYEDYLFHQLMPYDLWKTGHQGGVHNSYLALLINIGILGLLSLFYFLGHIIVRIRDRLFMVPALFVFLFTAVFESWMAASLNAFHVYFMIMIIYLSEEGRAEERK